MNLESADRQFVLHKLHIEWALVAALSLSFLAGGFVLLSFDWQPDLALRWLLLPAVVALMQLGVLWKNLPANMREGETALLPDLGWGNRLTLLRGLLVAGMTGFLMLPRPEGWLSWAPGILYTLSDAADFFDGYVARRTDHATRLGRILDMSFDGLGVLVASTLVVLYGQAPAWYLLVGLARYLFLAGEWLRRCLGKPVYPIPPSLNRRVFAGLQMGFLAVALWPVFEPPGIHIAAALFGLPLLFGFGRDWLYASGVVKDYPAQHAGRPTWVERWLPVGLRVVVLVLYLNVSLPWQTGSTAVVLVGLLHLLAVAMLLLGVLPRIASILGLLALGFAQFLAPLTAGQIALGIAYTLVLYIGSGALSLWAPEDYLYHNYAGERRALGAGQVL
jgi:CDP-diacylglycerol--glycerol-3-phosphate 3-phosphatidyltransferase